MRYHIDTDFLIFGLSAAGPERGRLAQLAESDEELQMSATAWYEFSRGLRTPEQLSVAHSLIDDGIIPLSEELAAIAGNVFRNLDFPRRWAAGIAIGTTAAAMGASLLTRNPTDFTGIPHLQIEGLGQDRP